MKKIKFVPREIFEKILLYVVIPTFDLVIEYGDQGVILVKRKIAPYQDKWALPGLRMFKSENIADTLQRIAANELGIKINPEKRLFLGQYVGKFTTENHRQDLSTGYLIKVSSDQEIKINQKHFSSCKIVKKALPQMGAMYKFYLQEYLKRKNQCNHRPRSNQGW